MRVTLSHNKSKQEVMQSVERSFDDLFSGIGLIPLQFTNERRSWQGSILTFSMSAKMGFVTTPISGTVHVTERDLTIDADLGFLERLIPAKAREALTSKVRGFLQ